MPDAKDTPDSQPFTIPTASWVDEGDLQVTVTSTQEPRRLSDVLCSLRLGGVPLVAYSIVDATLAAGPMRRGS